MQERIVGILKVPFSLAMKNYERFSLIMGKRKHG
jgi:hypothetical protein